MRIMRIAAKMKPLAIQSILIFFFLDCCCFLFLDLKSNWYDEEVDGVTAERRNARVPLGSARLTELQTMVYLV